MSQVNQVHGNGGTAHGVVQPATSSKRQPRHRPRQNCIVAWCFLIVILCTALPATIFLPAGGGADEVQHIARVDQLSHGELLARQIGYRKSGHQKEDALYGGYVDDALYRQSSRAAAVLQLSDVSLSSPTFHDSRANTGLRYGKHSSNRVFSNTAVNSPIAYLPQLIGFEVGKIFTDSAYWLIVCMRIGGIIAYAGIGFLAIWLLPWGKWLLALPLMLPGTILTYSAVSADVMTTACIALLFALAMRATLSGHLSRWQLVLFCSAAVIVACLKTTYAPVLAFLFLPFFNPLMRNKKMVIITFSTAAVSGTLLLAWYACVHSINTGAMYFDTIHPKAQTAMIIHRPLKSLARTLAEGPLAHNPFFLDLSIYGRRLNYGPQTLIIVAFIAACLYEAQHWKRSLYRFNEVATGLCLVVLATLCAILVALAIWMQFTAAGQQQIVGIQDRYYVSLLPFMLVPFVWVLSAGTGISAAGIEETKATAVEWRLSVATAILGCLPAIFVPVMLVSLVR
jgi:uncharacterized membrane protein